MRVLVTGGAGYIGSHAVRELIGFGCKVYVLDDLSTGHRRAMDPAANLIVGSTSDYKQILTILESYRIEAVLHFAASIEVAESVSDPYKYYQNNFANSIQLLHAMKDAGVQKLVFSSTAAVYGEPEKTPITEDQARNPINPYGKSKMMTEMAIEDFARAYGMGYTILRYFNVAGAHPNGDIGEDHKPESHLVPRILAAASDAQNKVKIYGTDYPTPDGTCIRDYVHVVDLARAHILALEATAPGKGALYNLGSENGFSVREVITACENVLGRKLPVIEEKRRAGDPAVLIASSRKIREQLDWNQLYPDIETIVRHAWLWHSSHPKGYTTEHAGPRRDHGHQRSDLTSTKEGRP
jgi:UDP-glucose 4-epimerase